MRYVRTNTATRITVGPFFDKTDGVTPETALTVTSCKLTLMVDDGGVPTLVLDTSPTASGGNNDMVHVTGDDAGFYDLELTAANLNYLGRAMLAITDAATHCPVFHELMILPAVVYDALVLGTDNLDINVAQWLGSGAPAAPPTAAAIADAVLEEAVTDHQAVASSLAEYIDFIAGNVDPAIVADAVWDEPIADHSGVAGSTAEAVAGVTAALGTPIDLGGSGATVAANLGDIFDGLTPVGSVVEALIIVSGGEVGATGNDATHVHLEGVSHENDSLNGLLLMIYDGSAARSYATWITDWVLATALATVETLPFTPVAGDRFNVLSIRRDSGLTSAEAQAAAAAAIAAYDPPTKAELDSVVAPLALEATAQSVLTDTGTDIPASLATIISYIDTEVAAILSAVDTEVAAIKAKTDNLPTDPADQSALEAAITAATSPLSTQASVDVIDGIVDAIKAVTDLLNSSQAEPTGVPAATATPLVKLATIYAVIRNKLTVTSTDKTFYGDNGVAQFKKALSDDGTTFTEDEVTTP